MLSQHYCNEHQSRFYRNEKADQNGEIKVWYSHKKADGSGFCTEKPGQDITMTQAKLPQSQPNSYNTIFSCNAMNNAIVLAANGKIELSQIGDYYKRILSELSSSY